VPSPCILVIRRNDRVSPFSSLSPDGDTEMLIDSIRQARLSRLVRVESLALHLCVSHLQNTAYVSPSIAPSEKYMQQS